MKRFSILFAAVVCACSDGDSDEPADSGIVFSDWHEPLAELNQTEQMAVCAYITGSFTRIGDPEETQRVGCILANRAAEARQCEQATAQCMQEPTRAPRECRGALLVSCPLLGTQVVRCLTERWLQLKTGYDAVTCNAVTDELAWTALSDDWSEIPTSCEVIQSECSDLFAILK